MSKNGKVALITGITGQDGSYLAELLLHKGYQINGIIRRSSSFNTNRIDHIYQDRHETDDYNFRLHYGDLIEASGILKIIQKTQPDELYHLGAQSHVRVSFDIPEYTAQVDALGTIHLLEALHSLGLKTKFYQASSSEMFGSTAPPQSESSPFYPRSPYAVSKVFAHFITVNYRESYNMFACSGILFNHESPRRGETFVTRKITRAIVNILKKKQNKLYLGNLDAKRDWGYAPEYVEAMWLMLQQNKPEDYVIATGEMHSVREFLTHAFELVGLDWEKYVEIDPHYFRPTEVHELCGDATKALKQLNWKPRVTFKNLVKIMLIADLEHEELDPAKFGLNADHNDLIPDFLNENNVQKQLRFSRK